MQNKGFTGADYAAAFERLGSYRAVSKELGVNESTVRRAINDYRRREGLDPGIKAALQETGISIDNARFGYRRIKYEDGSFNTVMWRAPEPEQADALERIIDAMNAVVAIPEIEPPKEVTEGLLGLHVIADSHVGATIQPSEGSPGYNRQEAVSRLKNGFLHCAQSMPACEVCIILHNGDGTHANDDKDATPKSGHKLKVEGSHQQNLFALEEAVIYQIEIALRKHGKVIVAIKRGNHDPNTPAPIIMGLRARYMNNPRVEVVQDEDPYFSFQMNRVFLCAHHGCGSAPHKRAQSIPHKFRKDWGISDFHWFFTGDKHHAKADTFGGLHWRQVPSVINLEQHSVEEGYTDTSGMYSAWFDTNTGRVSETTFRF